MRETSKFGGRQGKRPDSSCHIGPHHTQQQLEQGQELRQPHEPILRFRPQKVDECHERLWEEQLGEQEN